MHAPRQKEGSYLIVNVTDCNKKGTFFKKTFRPTTCVYGSVSSACQICVTGTSGKCVN